MNRREFTRNLAKLIDFMTEHGDTPVIDYVLRSSAEQKRLYDMGLSKCDGIINKSRHQLGLAVDLYLAYDTDIDFEWKDNNRLTLYRTYWESMGGKPMIEWDKGHWE